MKKYLSMDTFGFVLMVSAGETIVSGVILLGQNLAWLLVLPIEFIVLVAIGVWIMGWN